MTAPAYVVVETAADGPILFVGPPRAVAADITLMNPGDRYLVLRDVGLKDHSGRLTHLPARHSVMPTVLRGGQQRRLRIALALPTITPAGEYRVALDILGETRRAMLHVTEEVALRVEPHTLWIANAQNTHVKRLTVTNGGNIPVPLTDVRDVPLRDDLGLAIDVAQMLQGLTAKPDSEGDEFVGVLIAPLRSGAIMGCLSLGIVGGHVTIAPGERRSLEVEITLPKPPPPNGRARARIPLMDATLDIVVLPSDVVQTPRGHPHEQRRETDSRTRNSTPRSTPVRRKK
jgi:hypothetical protein